MHKQLLIVKRKKAKQLHEKGWSVNRIAHHLLSNWSSINRWINMEQIDTDNRGWKKGRLRRYDKKTKERVINIRNKLRAEESYFFGPQVVLANYRKRYKDDKEPTMYFITNTIREAGLTTVNSKEKRDNRSCYMKYPRRALDKLGKVVLGIDFVGPRYIEQKTEGVHFLSRKYIRPMKYGLIDRVEGQTTDEVLRVLIKDWKEYPLPEVVRMDNDAAFGEYNTHPHCIGRFTKVLLNLGITPLYCAPRQPWNNGATEGYNSMFARKFWEQLRFNDEQEIDVAIHKFNLEYEKYNHLVGNNIAPEEVNHRTLAQDFKLPQAYEQRLRKDQPMSIYWLRVVRQQTKKRAKNDKGTIKLLGEEIELPQAYINQFTLNKLEVNQERLSVMVEDENKRLKTIKQKRLRLHNANYFE